MYGFDSWNDELYHHGIKGQKWGFRRYQNEDGSLTAEGKKRYGILQTGSKASKKAGEKYLSKAKALSEEQKKFREIYKNNPNGIERYLQKEYGDQYKNPKIMRDKYLIDDPYMTALEYIKDRDSVYSETISSYKQKGQKWLKVSEQLKNTPISKMDDDYIKKAKKVTHFTSFRNPDKYLRDD